MTWITNLLEQSEIVKDKSTKFYEKGNSTAGGDARKALQAMKTFIKEGRDDIQKVKTERKAAKLAAKA